MRWQQGRRSTNIEDRRGGGRARGGRSSGKAGSGMGFLMTAVLVIGGLIFGVNPMTLINMTGGLGNVTGGGGSGGLLSGGGGGVNTMQAPTRMIRPGSLSPRYWLQPKTPGTKSSEAMAHSMKHPSLFYSRVL